jgi:hypothetical protein
MSVGMNLCGDRFRAVNSYAEKNGFYGAFPTFWEKQNQIVYGTWLLKKGAAEFRDIPASELTKFDPTNLEERFRAVQAYAEKNGFYGAFPTFWEDDTKRGKVYGVWLLKKGVAEFRNILASDLKKFDTNNCGERFRAVQAYAEKNGFGGAFPTFWEDDTEKGKVYGTWLLKKDFAEFRDVPDSVLGNPQSPIDHFKKVQAYAEKNGFYGAFPTFWKDEKGKAYGVRLLKKGVAEFRDIPASELMKFDPTNLEERFRAVQAYAEKNGFGGAFPTFWEDDTEKGKVYGTWLLKKDFAEFRDVLFYDLLKSLIRPGDIIYGWETSPGHVGIIVDDKSDLVVREAYPKKGVANISLKDFCDVGDYHKELGFYPNYSQIGIFRVDCSNEKAKDAANIAKGNLGEYDDTYITAGIGLIACGSLGLITALFTAGLTLIPAAIGALAILPVWKTAWDDGDIWYCSKLVYKAYYRAGHDLYPPTGPCTNPLKGEYPYLFDGRSPWWLITPWQVCTAKSVHPIWTWRR